MFKFILLSIFVLLFNTKAYSLELLMINSKNCIYCKKFLAEVAVDYSLTQQLPLKIINDYDRPEWFSKAYKQNKIKPYRGTPIFIIWNEIEEYEINRIRGYRSKDNFYQQLKNIFVKFVNENENS